MYPYNKSITIPCILNDTDSSGDDRHVHNRRRGLLRMYYGVDEDGPLQEENPLDIDKTAFKPSLFMERVLKECSLNQLYKQEEKMKKGMYVQMSGWGWG